SERRRRKPCCAYALGDRDERSRVAACDDEADDVALAPVEARVVERGEQVLDVDAGAGRGLWRTILAEQLIVATAARDSLAGATRKQREADARVIGSAANL